MSLFTELKRRNVFRVAAAYLVVGWLLTEVLTAVLPLLGAPDWLPRAVILVFVFGFIPAVVLSWIYELTPEGIKKEEDVEHDDSANRKTIRKLDYATISGVAVMIVFLAFFSANTGTISNASVAVLPFVNLSSNEDNEYFSDGLTETLLHMLAQVPGLKVAARTSSFAFKDKKVDIREIGDALQVAHVLEGSVQQAGDQIRVTAQLIRAEDGFHIWSVSFDETIDDIFAIQDDIATRVRDSLAASILGEDANGEIPGISTDIPDAYDLYLQALKARATFSYGGLKAAEELLKGALTIDSDFLDAKTELASNYLHQWETGLMSQADTFALVLAITDQVLTERPSDVVARAIQLFARAAPHTRVSDADIVLDAVSQLENLVTEHPDEYQARLLLTRLLQGLRQLDKALELQLDALHRDPYNARIQYEIGSLYLALEQFVDARTALQKSLEIEPRQPNAYLRLATVALQTGNGVESLRLQLKAMVVDPRDHEIPAFIAGFLYQFGLFEEGDEFRDRVLAIAPTTEIAYRIELVRAISAGDEDAGIASARRAIEDDIDDRQFAYGGAVQYLMRTAARRGTVAETSAYLEQQAPGIFDIDALSAPQKYRTAQLTAFDAWYTALTRNELLVRIEKTLAIAAAFGVDLLENSRIEVGVAAMRGDLTQAIDVALSDVFSQPVTVNPGWRDDFAQAQFKEFVADPRIQAAMQVWDSEEAAIRSRLKTFLSNLSSTSQGI